MRSKSLASRLNNRIELWGNAEVETNLGMTYDEVLLKKLWADIYPLSGSTSKESANTESNTVKFKIIVRKTEIQTDNFIIFQGKRFDISYIYPDFNDNRFIEIIATLKTE